MLTNLFSQEILHIAAVRAAGDKLRTRSQMLHLVANLDVLTAEVTLRRTIGTVVRQMLVKEATFERRSTTVAARYWVELALFRVILTYHPPHRHNNDIYNDSTNISNKILNRKIIISSTTTAAAAVSATTSACV